MPETAAPPKPTGQEINLSDLPKGRPSDSLRQRAIAAATGQPAPTPEPEAAIPEAKPDDTAPAKAQDAPKDTKPSSDTTKGREGPKELREALERATKKADELTASVTATAKEKADALTKQAELEAKFNTLQKKVDTDYEPKVQELEVTRKKLQEREEALRIKDYMSTPEFHEKYVKPIADTEADISALLSESTVNMDGQQIQASREHFDYIMGARTLNEAGERAVTLFGPHVGPQIVNHRAKLQSQLRTKAKAAETAQLDSMEHFKQQQMRQTEVQNEIKTYFRSEADRLMQSDPDLKAPDGDQEWAAAINEGKQFAESLFSPSMDRPQKEILTDAARGYTNNVKIKVQELKIRKLEKEVTTLRENLKQYQSSEPGVETRNGGKGPEVTESNDPKVALTQRAVEAARKYNSPRG